MEEFCGAPFWDINLTWNTTSPRFTPCFEQTILVWIPTAFLILLFPLDVWVSSQEKQEKLPLTSPLTLGKSLITIILIILEIGIGFGFPESHQELSTTVKILGPVLNGMAYVLFLGLLLYSRRCGVQSSGVQTLFWFVLSICEVIKFSTIIQDAGDEETATEIVELTLHVIYFAFVLAQFVLHIFADPGTSEQIVSSDSKKGKHSNISPEPTSSFLSKILVHWFTPLIYMGYKKPLEYADLWKLNEEDTSKVIVAKFDSKYENDLNKAMAMAGVKNEEKFTTDFKMNVPSKPGLKKKNVKVVWALLKSYGGPFFVGAVLQLVPDLLSFVSPQILSLLIAYVSTDEPLWKGLLYTASLFLVGFIRTIILNESSKRFFLVGMRTRTALVSAIYRKALVLSTAAKKDTTMGEIVNLMTVDAQRATEFLLYIYILWSAPLQIGLALYFLWDILGPSSIAGLAVMFLLMPVNGLVASKLRTLQISQLTKKDERVKLMNDILSGIRALKFYAWETCYEEKVMAIRKIELKKILTGALWNSITMAIFQTSSFLIALGTFATYVLIDSNNVLDASKVFVSQSFLNIVSVQLTFVPIVISTLVQASVSYKRIDKYLNMDEINPDAVTHDTKEVDPIVIENGTFAWDSGEPSLRKINMRVKTNALVAVVGSVGSGKSTLLAAILGELEKIEGRVNTKGNIAYVTQQAWIQNATLRDNILFGKPYDPVRYDRVLEACQLKPDLKMLTAGDKTEIGEKGINLSGGQKQRVALARATYADADLYLFDDPLSAVDAHVGKHIFEKLVGPDGLLRKKTRVLVTHGIIYLPFVDHIYVIKEGQITRNGTYRELLNDKGDFANFLKSHIMSEDLEDLEGTELMRDILEVMDSKSLEVLKERKDSLAMSIKEHGHTNENTIQRRNRTTTTSSMQEELNWLTSSTRRRTTLGGLPTEDKLIETEHSETESVKVGIYLDYFKAAGIVLSVAALFLYLTFQVSVTCTNLWLTEWSNEPSDTFAETRDFYLGIYGGIGAVQVLAMLGASIVMAFGTSHSASSLHRSMLKRILQAPMSFFDTTPIGRIVNRFAKDVDIIDNILPMLIGFMFSGILGVTGTLVIISYATPEFIAVIIPVMILYYLVQRFYLATSRQLKRLESVTRSPIYSHFGETISGASTIRAYRQQARFIKDSEAKVDHNQISSYSTIIASRWLAVRLETIGNIVVLFAALFAVLARDTLDPGTVGLSISNALSLTGALLMLVRVTSEVESNIVAVERLQEYSNAPQEAPFEIPESKPALSWPESGKVVFSGYQTRYRPGLDLVLSNVTCTIEPGEKIGIVGRTGAGKSSLTLALFRIIEPAGGKIMIDGEDITKFGLHDIRGRFAIIPQDPVLFSGSLRTNLDPLEVFSDETIWNSLELAHLKPFVQTLPAGLSHEIAEAGENLSVGQRQLICLARALLRKTKILVLDEATAAVDLDTDNLIQQTIRKEFQYSTVITIAHRLNTILDSTRVIVLDKGEIKEFDSPQALLNNPDSIFSSMAKDAGL